MLSSTRFRWLIALATALYMTSPAVATTWATALDDRVIRALKADPNNTQRLLVGNKGRAPGTAHVFLSTNGGETWRQLNGGKSLSPEATDVQAVAFGSGNIIFAGTWKHGLFRSLDAGESFAPVTTLDVKDIRDVLVTPAGTMLLATGTAGVLRSQDAGVSWVRAQSEPAYLWSISLVGTILFASSPSAGVFRSTDDGASWHQVLKDQKVHEVAGKDRFAAAAGPSGLFVSRDAGTSWTPVRNAAGQNLSSVSVFGPNNILVGHWDGGAFTLDLSHEGKPTNVAPGKTTVHVKVYGDQAYLGTWGNGLLRGRL